MAVTSVMNEDEGAEEARGDGGGLCILEEGRWTSYRRRGSERERETKRRVGGIFEREEGHGRKGGRGGIEGERRGWRGE